MELKNFSPDDNVVCPKCGEKQFSPFDKLYVQEYNECVVCTDEHKLEKRGEYIFSKL